ncbi:hypothetical protein CSKR_111857 [Clonorchis sinensis]|uniref:Uncharacterized protein n=1 Tax=Clonorchis sinensis TaxID=79923 RepID=A0A3R7C2H3_CLOSI|nr:hypothetical protein CSKR_111857 [Clonorchis sinensis]
MRRRSRAIVGQSWACGFSGRPFPTPPISGKGRIAASINRDMLVAWGNHLTVFTLLSQRTTRKYGRQTWWECGGQTGQSTSLHISSVVTSAAAMAYELTKPLLGERADTEASSSVRPRSRSEDPPDI